MIVLIPAYEPDQKLVDLVTSLRHRGQTVVVVDDGSGPDHQPVFQQARALGCDVIGHLPNRGKGYALKRGFRHIATAYPGRDVVCADCDGQHRLTDIAAVASAVREHRAGIVLGARRFAGGVPLRSRFGNDVTRMVFRLSTGLRLQDTQTGLRAYPAWMLGWLQTIEGDRFEYELEVLLAARRAGVELHEVPIATIYLEENASSHFHPVRDSIRVYVPFLKFSMSSLTAFGIDVTLFFAMMAETGSLAASVVSARLVSASVNFAMNHRLVFAGGRRRPAGAALRYAALVAALMAVNYALLSALTGALGVGIVLAKLLTEVTLFVASYQFQQRVVFPRQTVATPDPEPGLPGSVDTPDPALPQLV
jgi:glycosyltransferase involved in cell wall biosynthesis